MMKEYEFRLCLAREATAKLNLYLLQQIEVMLMDRSTWNILATGQTENNKTNCPRQTEEAS